MLSELKSKLQKKLLLTDEIWNELMPNAKEINLRKGEVLIRYSSKNKFVYILVKGALRQSIINSSGETKSIWFYFDNTFDIAITPDSYYLDQPTKYEVVALEDATVFRISEKKVDELVTRFPIFNKFYREDILKSLVITVELRSHMIINTPADFIKYLKKHFPEITRRVPSKYLAEFIGITPEWLSKIKSNS